MSANNNNGNEIEEQDESMMTIVSTSNLDTNSSNSTTTTTDYFEDDTTTTANSSVVVEAATTATSWTDVCRLKEGIVCICLRCEAQRTRLLNRRAASSSYVISKHSNKRSHGRGGGDDDGEDESRDAVLSATTTDENIAVQRKKPRIVMTEKDKMDKMTTACQTILECIGEDPSREGLCKTPERWAKALLYMTHGYDLTCRQVTGGAVFEEENHDEMVVVKDIDIHSLCEHHMVPFTGRAHIGYIPNGKILGLSKMARIAEMYARRLQVQERLTRQIADAIVEAVQPLGVAVVVESTHLCMVMRGVQKVGATTVTSSVRGCFESNPKTRAEFFSIIHGHGMKMC